MLDALPTKPLEYECGIVNLDKSSGPGTHWVAYKKNKDCIQYFDSFGNLQPPKEIVKYLGKNLMYNFTRYQQFGTVNCGHLALKFLVTDSDFDF